MDEQTMAYLMIVPMSGSILGACEKTAVKVVVVV